MEREVKYGKCKNCGKRFEHGVRWRAACSLLCEVELQSKKEAKKEKRTAIRKETEKTAAQRVVFKNNVSELKAEQIARVGYTYCERCGKRCNPSGHHVIFRSEFPNHPNLHDKRNIYLVCDFSINSCHDFFHNLKQNRDYLIIERNLVELFGTSILNKSNL